MARKEKLHRVAVGGGMAGIGFEYIAVVVIFAAIGYALDFFLSVKVPSWFFIAGLFIGLIAGTYHLIRRGKDAEHYLTLLDKEEIEEPLEQKMERVGRDVERARENLSRHLDKKGE